MKLIRFLTFFFIFVGLDLQTTHLSHDKNDVTHFLSCDITPIFFRVRTYTKLEISYEIYPPSCSLALIRYRKSLLTFPGIFWNIPRNLFDYSQESFSNIPRNLFEHSPESFRSFPGIFFNIPRNVKIITFPGIL